jgi:putative oxidoreductase
MAWYHRAVPETALYHSRDLGLLLLRLGVGFGFIYFHGWEKLSEGPERWTAVGGAVAHVGIGFGHTAFGFLAALSESVGALLIAIGFLFRPVAALLACTMTLAVIQHIATGQGTPAHAFKNAWVFVGLLLVGPGRWSLDAWIDGWRGGREDGGT